MKRIDAVLLILVAVGNACGLESEYEASHRQVEEWISWHERHDENVAALSARVAAIIAGEESDIEDVRADIDEIVAYAQGRAGAVRATDISKTPKLAKFRDLLAEYFEAQTEDFESLANKSIDIATDVSYQPFQRHQLITATFNNKAIEEEGWASQFAAELANLDTAFDQKRDIIE